MQSPKNTENLREPWKHQPHSAETRARIAAKMRNNRNAARPEGAPKRVQLSVRVNESTLEAFSRAAAKRGMKIGAWLDAIAADEIKG